MLDRRIAVLDGFIVEKRIYTASGWQPASGSQVQSPEELEALHIDLGAQVDKLLSQQEEKEDNEIVVIEAEPPVQSSTSAWPTTCGAFQRQAIADLVAVKIVPGDAAPSVQSATTVGTAWPAWAMQLPLDRPAVLKFGCLWSARHGLVKMALTLPPRRLQLWLDVCLAYVAHPDVSHVLDDRQIAMIHEYRQLPDWARATVGMAGLFRLLRHGAMEADTSELVTGLQRGVKARLALKAPAGVTGRGAEDVLQGWLFVSQSDPVLAMENSALIRIDGWTLAVQAAELVEDAARLMLGYGPSHAEQAREFINMVLGLSGLAKFPRPDQPSRPWSYFKDRAGWLRYKAALRWLDTVRLVCSRLVLALQSKADITDCVLLLQSVVSHALRKPEASSHVERTSAYEWQVRSQGVAQEAGDPFGIPELRLNLTTARAICQGSSGALHFFSMPDGGEMVSMPDDEWAAANCSHVRVYCEGLFWAGFIQDICARHLDLIGGMAPLSLQDLLTSSAREPSRASPKAMLLDAGRLMLFILSLPSRGLLQLQTICWERCGALFNDTKSYSAVSYLCDLPVIGALSKSGFISTIRKLWKKNSEAQSPTRDMDTPARNLSMRIPTVSIRTQKPLAAGSFAFLSPIFDETFDKAGTRMSFLRNGKQRALYPGNDGFFYNVERFVARKLVSDANFLRVITAEFRRDTSSAEDNFVEVDESTPPLLLRSLTLPAHCLNRVCNKSGSLLHSLSKLDLSKSKEGMKSQNFYLDENIFGVASAAGLTAIHSENALIPTVAFCFALDFIMSPDRVWKHPFASQPSDGWGCDNDGLRRSNCGFAQDMQHRYRQFFGAHGYRVRWDIVDETLLGQVCHAAGYEKIAAICKRFLCVPEAVFMGMPDVLLFSSANCTGNCDVRDQTICFVEVKSHTDTVRDGQVGWVEFLIDHGIPAGIVQFHDPKK